MRTVKWNPFLSGVVALLGGMLLWAGAARADISSTNAAAILVFPKLVVDETTGVDTIVQLTNTAPNPVNVRCFYVDASGHCSNSPATFCAPGAPADEFCSPPGFCVPGWIETDFSFRLTANQPIVWTVSAGLPMLPLAIQPGIGGQFNSGSIPPAPENPMDGELKCVEVGDDELPVENNDLKGEATIETVSDSPSVDIEGYNAIGIQAIAGANNRDNTLVIGQEYNACPNNLILDHFFDDAVVLDSDVRTALTLVPCTEDFNTQLPLTTTVQFLVYNEFEQRFSTSRPLTCFSELLLSDIDTRVGNANNNDASSIFNVAVEGTLSGQTVIRGVGGAGHGLLGVAEEFHFGGEETRSAAYMLYQRGQRTDFDTIQLPGAQACLPPGGPCITNADCCSGSCGTSNSLCQ